MTTAPSHAAELDEIADLNEELRPEGDELDDLAGLFRQAAGPAP